MVYSGLLRLYCNSLYNSHTQGDQVYWFPGDEKDSRLISITIMRENERERL